MVIGGPVTILVDTEGNPVIYDPATYWGHHEAELGMTYFLGGFSPQFYESYHELIPKASGFEKRVDIYALYHAMNINLNLFGNVYIASMLSPW